MTKAKNKNQKKQKLDIKFESNKSFSSCFCFCFCKHHEGTEQADLIQVFCESILFIPALSNASCTFLCLVVLPAVDHSVWMQLKINCSLKLGFIFQRTDLAQETHHPVSLNVTTGSRSWGWVCVATCLGAGRNLGPQPL